MYRQHLRMVQLQDLESNRPRSEFIHRVTSIPVVYFAWNIASETYSNVKHSNKILATSLNTSEIVAGFITRPVFQRFEKQLKTVDRIACRGFEALQEIVPFIYSQPQKLYMQTKDLYEDTVESGLRKYEIIKKVGTNKLLELMIEGSEKFEEFRSSPYGEVFELALDFALEAGEMYVDHYLPPLGDERPEKVFGDRGKEPALKRTEFLRNRLKERLYKYSLLKLQLMRLKTRSMMINIYHTNYYEYIVEISTSIPGFVVNVISQTFSNLQDLIYYLTFLLKLKHEQNELV